MKPVYTRAGIIAVSIAALIVGFALGLASREIPIASDVSWLQLSALGSVLNKDSSAA